MIKPNCVHRRDEKGVSIRIQNSNVRQQNEILQYVFIMNKPEKMNVNDHPQDALEHQ
jgi:hypothetical protein